jgi:glutamine amidotransferase
MIALIDIGISNLASIARALDLVGAPGRLVSDAGALEEPAAIVMPGVGAFGDAMARLNARGLAGPIRDAARRGVPVLGVCLGMQLLAEASEEHGNHAGLGLLPGAVVRLRPNGPGLRVPNIGWSDVTPTRPSTLFPTAKPGSFYHVHSYHWTGPAALATATIDYGGPVVVGLEQGDIMGVQFHPEKSQADGLDVLAAFVAKLRAAGRLH